MKTSKAMRVLSLVLVLALFCSMFPAEAFAASYSYYQTAKADVPIWSQASSKSPSTKVRVIAQKGTVVKVTGSTKNDKGNTWYKLTDGNWVYSENVTSHKHDYTGGICKSAGCGYEWPYKEEKASGIYEVTNADGVGVRNRPYSKNSVIQTRYAKGTVLTVVGKTTNQEGNLWYKLSNGYWVYSENVTRQYTISYNANGGTGGPGDQKVLYKSSVTISNTKPTRKGYLFQGWSTSSSSSLAIYKSGSTHKYNMEGDLKLYAVWKACSHDYSDGICKTCGYEYPLDLKSLSGTFVVTKEDGSLVRTKPYNGGTSVRREAYKAVLSVNGKVTNADGSLWYRLTDGNWIFSGNVTQQFTITYDANGGQNAPSAQTVLKGQIVQITSKEPTRTGYTFKGWATSKNAKDPTHKYGMIHFYTFDKDTTLYAVWQACSHSYSGGICEKCGYEFPLDVKTFSGTFVVTSDSCAVRPKPYKNAGSVRNEQKGAVLSVVAKTTNQEGNDWYKLADGNWVYSENVSKQLTLTFDANGGTGGPAPQKVLKGQKVKVPETKPTRTGYTFKGWSVTKLLNIVAYKPGETYTFDSSIDMTLYAVWDKCEHKYIGGICDKCGYEYPLDVKSTSGTYVVTNADGAKVWNRPYSNKSTEIRQEKKGAVLTVKSQTTNQEGNIWYKLSDGNWVFSANVTQQYTLTYDTNGGTGDFPAQKALAGSGVTIHSAKPVKDGYIFKGWATISKPNTVECQPGKSYTLSGDVKLVAVWEKCSHSYVGGLCEKCGDEYPLKVTDFNATFVVTRSNGSMIRPRPYDTAKEVRREPVNAVLSVNGKVTNEEGNLWYRLTDGNWVFSENVTQQFTVSYNANGGSGAPKAQKVLYYHYFTVSATEPTRTGYIFLGWATVPNVTEASITPGKDYNYSLNKDLTLYAIWKTCAHNSGQTARVTAPTCTDEGYTTFTCTACGYSYVGQKVSAKGHSYGAWKVTTKPGCTAAGVERRDCANCDHYQTQEVAAKGHSYKTAATAPTCAEQGYTTHTCTSCGHSYKDAYVDAVGHNYESVVTEPTDTKQGYTTHTCTVCGESFVDSYVDPKGHSYESVVTAPTCTEKGYTTHTCTDCGDSYVDSYVDVLPHSYTDSEDKTCNNCGFEQESEEAWLLGDVDHSGSVDFFDGMIILQYYAGLIDESGLDVSLADVDNSGSIDFFDGMYILQFYAGILEKLPVE